MEQSHCFADEVASKLFELLRLWWHSEQPFLPSSRKDSWMVWLTKPGKTPDHPKHLRPLALQEPLGKCVMTLLAQHLRNFAFMKLCTWPQWAYIHGRGTGDALARVSAHCELVQSKLRAHARRTPHSIAEGHALAPICGGLQLFVDLSRAFDSIPRQYVFQSVVDLWVPPLLYKLIRSWHTDTHYRVTTTNFTDAVPTEVGIREGCTCAPILWSISMWRLMIQCFHDFGPWILEALNLFADDFHVCDTFDNANAFVECLHKLDQLLDIVEEAGLTIDLDKTQMILALKGTKQAQLLKQHTERSSKGWYILIPRKNGVTSRIKLVKQAVHLGAVINYTDHKDATVRSRIKCSLNAFNRLRKWLCGSRCLTQRNKFQLWQSCVLSILLYALPDIGITAKGCHHILSNIITMLRRIYRDHPYHTGRTHQAFFSIMACQRL